MDNDKRVGRPTKFNEAITEKILQLCTAGKTTDQIAEIIGVNPRTIYNWMSSKPEFYQSLKESKQAADEIVEASLFHRATGYRDSWEKEVVTKDGQVVTVTEELRVPPDTTAAIFWLKNRQPENWRDKTEVEVSALKTMSDEDLKKHLEELRKRQLQSGGES